MKYIHLFLLLFISNISFGQATGNKIYRNSNHSISLQSERFKSQLPNHTINIQPTTFSSKSNIYLSIKGMVNLKADNYVAIFSLTQVGKTIQEINTLIDQRIQQAKAGLADEEGLEIYIDMISFVPLYDYEVEKKVFSKKTYNEIPSGFELKKNIHIQYQKSEQLNKIVTAMSAAEIYDLVKVDYFSNQIDTVKAELAQQAQKLLQQKLKNYQTLLGEPLDSMEKQVHDGYQIVYPIERYDAYQAYNSSSLQSKKADNVNRADKSTTLYYEAISDQGIDFVLNPTILEPSIQLMYEIKLFVNRTKALQEKQRAKELKTSKDHQVIPPPVKEYYLLLPDGTLKQLKL